MPSSGSLSGPVTGVLMRSIAEQHSPKRSLTRSERELTDALREIPLLRAEDEVELAHAIEAGVLAWEKLQACGADGRSSVHPVLAEELAALVSLGEQARERLIRANLRLVAFWAHRRLRSGKAGTLEFDELLQEGVEGLAHAVRKFDFKLGYKFSTYASHWIRQRQGRAAWRSLAVHVPDALESTLNEVTDARRRLIAVGVGDPSVEQIAAEAGVASDLLRELLAATGDARSLDAPAAAGTERNATTFGELLADPNAADPAEVAAAADYDRWLLRRMSALPERQQRVLRLRLGLPDGVPMSREHAAATLRVSVPRIEQAERAALATLTGEIQR
jgi:RNA polymerase primary sigma factor